MKDDQLSLFGDKLIKTLTGEVDETCEFHLDDNLGLSLIEIHRMIPDCINNHVELFMGEYGIMGYNITAIEVYEKRKVYHVKANLTRGLNDK
jgi:hypothetical protein